MDQSILTTFLIIHLAVAVLYAFLIITRKSSLTPANILPIVCIPVFGILSAAAADMVFIFKKADQDTETIETLTLTEDIYWKSIKKRDEARNIVPLEEALIINDRQTRKKLILEMLLDDPLKNIDILLLARENNDVDTAHYANTSIAKIQRDFQLQVQKLAATHESNPDDVELLNSYIDTLRKFIESGLSEAYLLTRQRIIYAELLEKKIKLAGWDKETLYQKIHNCLALKDINTAVDAVEMLKDHFPDEEQTWIRALETSVAGLDTARLADTILEIQQRKIEWSPSGKEQIQAWIKV